MSATPSLECRKGATLVSLKTLFVPPWSLQFSALVDSLKNPPVDQSIWSEPHFSQSVRTFFGRDIEPVKRVSTYSFDFDKKSVAMSDTTSSFPTPSTSPAFQQLSDTNHGPWVVVAAYIFILLSIITVWIKVWTRYQTTRKIVFNDAFILLSLVR